MSLDSPHSTLLKFGYPASLVHEGRHWALLVRPSQPTLGSLVLCAREPVLTYAAMPVEAFAEQGGIVRMVEATLRRFCDYQRINYLMLMMVDPHVHFHILPRYEGQRSFDGIMFTDAGWPGLPDLSKGVPTSPQLIAALRRAWRSNDEEGF